MESKMERKRFRIRFTEPILGSAPNNKQVYEDFIASKAPDALSTEDEIAAVGVAEYMEKGMTVFPRDEADNPIFWDYHIKGFMKDACGMMNRVKGSKSKELKAYKKVIDGLIFVFPRQIPICFDSDIETLQRPLRAQTAQGERIALAMSEMIKPPASIDIEVQCLDDALFDVVYEWLDYGALRGLSQWRNASYGRFTWEELKR